jgi:phosphoribosyl 1,2-cyclic phosphodiesterase
LQGVLRAQKGQELICSQFTTGSAFEIGDISLEPFSIPHDAYEPVGFVIRNSGYTIGLATDIGIVTNLLREKLRVCDVVVIEANHDEAMVHEASRPWSLKQRILSNQGHLSNRASAGLIADIAGERLLYLFLAHLSSDCNSPSHARRAFETVLAESGHTHVKVFMTGANHISELLELG